MKRKSSALRLRCENPRAAGYYAGYYALTMQRRVLCGYNQRHGGHQDRFASSESSKRIRSVIADHREMSRYGMRRLMKTPPTCRSREAGTPRSPPLGSGSSPDLCCSIPACGMSHLRWTPHRTRRRRNAHRVSDTQEDEQRVRWTLRSAQRIPAERTPAASVGCSARSVPRHRCPRR